MEDAEAMASLAVSKDEGMSGPLEDQELSEMLRQVMQCVCTVYPDSFALLQKVLQAQGLR